MVRTITAELWQRETAVLGESPAWDVQANVLSWVDVVAARVHVSNANGSAVADYQLPSHVGAALPAAGGGWLVALPDRLARLRPDGSLADVAPLEAHLPSNRANDAKCDPTGRAWVGTMNYDEEKATGSLYRVDNYGRTTAVLSGLGIANGLGWSPDGQTMYFIDTSTHEVRAYPFDQGTGSLGQPTCVARIEPGDGHPDGMCTDDDGCIWVALFAGGCVRRYTPDGTLDTVVRLPVTYTTSCCFGGTALDHLFITTARRDLDEEGLRREPLAGSVWCVEPGVTGPAATPWLG